MPPILWRLQSRANGPAPLGAGPLIPRVLGKKHQALLVVGNDAALTAGDLIVQAAIERAGFDVILRDDSATADLTRWVVVIAESCTSANVAAKYSNFIGGVVVLEGGVVDDMNMSAIATTITAQLTAADTVQLGSQDPAVYLPLVLGLPDFTTVTLAGGAGFSPSKSAVTDLAASVTQVFVVNAGLNAVEYAYEVGDTMQAAHVAEGRRVFFGIGIDTDIANLNSTSLSLLEAAIDWAGKLPQPVVSVFDPATGFPWVQDQNPPTDLPPVSDDPQQAWAVNGPAPFNPATGIPWTTPQDEPAVPPVSDDPQQAWAIKATAPFVPVQPQDEPPVPPISDDPAQSWAIQPPTAAAAFDPSTGFPWTTFPEDPIGPGTSDDPQQAWAVNGPAAPVTFDPSTGFPWPRVQDEPTAASSTDDTQQAWAIKPALTFVGNAYDDAIAQPIWTDDPQQAWAIKPPAAAPTFDPATGFPWVQPQEVPPISMYEGVAVHDAVQPFAIGPPATFAVVPQVLFDIETGDAFVYLGSAFIERVG